MHQCCWAVLCCSYVPANEVVRILAALSLPRDEISYYRGSAWIEFEPNPEDEPSEKACSISGKVRIHANKLFIDYAPDSVVCFRYDACFVGSLVSPSRSIHAYGTRG